ncbi:hypothetical protein BpHYR1_045179 [Brachionus plicatilis]|uniref:Uncharacterized protein n=1 Tax=Brachionus plicatilis TaxID=10195 RepID=A0A3M7SC17_BRAPC|nr:hypothetical protein BpHYR1_045179 [Brachionus plicatilis]
MEKDQCELIRYRVDSMANLQNFNFQLIDKILLFCTTYISLSVERTIENVNPSQTSFLKLPVKFEKTFDEHRSSNEYRTQLVFIAFNKTFVLQSILTGELLIPNHSGLSNKSNVIMITPKVDTLNINIIKVFGDIFKFRSIMISRIFEYGNYLVDRLSSQFTKLIVKSSKHYYISLNIFYHIIKQISFLYLPKFYADIKVLEDRFREQNAFISLLDSQMC